MTRFVIAPESSTILVVARSTMGPITFEGHDLRGHIEAEVRPGAVDLDVPPKAHLRVGLAALHSGNDLYDAELQRRIAVKRFPACELDLRSADYVGDNRYYLRGGLTVHDRTREIDGTVMVDHLGAGRMSVVGEKTIDIRDFDISAPNVLLLRIYPEVRVQVFLDVRAEIAEEQP